MTTTSAFRALIAIICFSAAMLTRLTPGSWAAGSESSGAFDGPEIDDAAFIQPSTDFTDIDIGHFAQVEFTLKNTGTTTWSSEAGYALQADNAFGLMPLIEIPSGVTIAAGESHTFIGSILGDCGGQLVCNYALGAVMLRQGVEFGEVHWWDFWAFGVEPTHTETPTLSPTPTATDTPTMTSTSTPTPTPDLIKLGDLDSSGCTDMVDFLFLLDNWQTVPASIGVEVDINLFLNILENWLTGSNC